MYGIICIEGDIKNGKTWLLTNFILENILVGRRVVANFDLNGLPYRRINTIDIKEDCDIANCMLAVDEAQKDLDNRSPFDKFIKNFFRFLTDSGKLDTPVYYTAHIFQEVDKKLRNHTNFKYKIIKDSTYVESLDIEFLHGFVIEFMNMYSGLGFTRYVPASLAVDLFPYYSSYKRFMSRFVKSDGEVVYPSGVQVSPKEPLLVAPKEPF